MYLPWQTISDVHCAVEVLRDRRFGLIESRSGLLTAIHFRPYPFSGSLAGAWFDRISKPWRKKEDCCRLYFNAPVNCPGFLTLAYLQSNAGTQLATVQSALRTLDFVANVKRSNAIVCDASNLRLTDRMLARYGYEKHAPKLKGRHFIKRFDHPLQFEFLRRPLAEIFPEQRLPVDQVLNA